jgi:hypothetical protein
VSGTLSGLSLINFHPAKPERGDSWYPACNMAAEMTAASIMLIVLSVKSMGSS